MSESKKKAIPDTKKRCAEAKKITNKKIHSDSTRNSIENTVREAAAVFF